jgi:dihydrodipicolinate synthase/N-acetylneuraminate lyase
MKMTRHSLASAPPLRPQRKILGISAVLLPFTQDGDVDWKGYESLLSETVAAGLVPALNMDTGYVQLLEPATRSRVLDVGAELAGDRGFVAGAFVVDTPGSTFNLDSHLTAMESVDTRGGTPVVFPSYGLNALDDAAWVAAHEAFGERCDRFIGFELGEMFVPYGRIYSAEAYEALLAVTSCIGAKHSSLSRALEWDRLTMRDRVRPDFHVFTGNDLAIDMVCYGSDYLLGLSAFAPEAFAERDRRWHAGDRSFHELNDLLQYLGAFAFRAPVPAYRHDAALFLSLRGRIASAATPAGAPRRPDSDRAVLADIADRLEAML